MLNIKLCNYTRFKMSPLMWTSSKYTFWQAFTNNFAIDVLFIPIHVCTNSLITALMFIYIKIYFIYRLLPLKFILIKMALCLGLYSKPFSIIHIVNNSKTGQRQSQENGNRKRSIPCACICPAERMAIHPLNKCNMYTLL